MRRLVSFATLVLAVLGPLPAWAVEYRLQVVSVQNSAFRSFLTLAEVKDGASGPGMIRLESTVDKGEMPKGVLLYDRPLAPAREVIAKAWGATPIKTEVRYGGEANFQWDEVRWEGKPGERSLWVITPSSRMPQEIERIALKGRGPLRQYEPLGVANYARKLPSASISLNFLQTAEDRGDVWDKHAARALDLGEGLGALVAVNDDILFPDRVYLVVIGAEEPTTYKAVLSWRRRKHDREEAPSFRVP